ncbi:MAG: gliding motility-associated C-terminal domain-containing protein [Saprospiraceae bacterium]
MKDAAIFLLMLLQLQTSFAQSNEGTNLWFGFMEHKDVGQTTMVAMITAKQNTSGTVTIPQMGWSVPFTVAANDVVVVQLPQAAETRGSETITKTGVQITAINPVSAYIHQYFEFRSEASIVLPIDAISTEYFVMSYTGIFNRGQDYLSEFLIVATTDETMVTITPSDRTQKGKNPNTPFSVMLNAGESYQVQASDASGDMTGSHVIADKKIAVFGGDSWTQVPTTCGTRDNLLEQMYPVSTWGKQILTVPSDQVTFDVFRILASEDNTIVEVQGTTSRQFQLNRGQFIEYQESVPTFIVGSKPILVAQYLVGQNCNGHSLGDPSMVLLNSIEQTRDTVTLFNSQFQQIEENYINVITRTADTEVIIFDGQKLVDRGVNFTPVGTKGDFSYARVSVAAGAHTISSEGCGVIATAYGYGFAESYAYSGGASFSNINANPIPEGGCLNDTVFFDTGLSPARYNFQWDLGDGNRTTAAQFEHYYPNLGAYPIELILEDECLGIIDTLNRDLIISLRKAVDAADDVQVCEDDPFQLSATDVADGRYEWSGPGNIFYDQQFPMINQAKVTMSGSYAVIGIVDGCATFPSFLNVDVKPTPRPNLGEDAVICVDLLDVDLDAGEYESYRWQDNSVSNPYTVSGGGDFWIEVIDEFGCIGADSLTLIQQCPTDLYIPNVFSPNGDNQNDEFTILGGDMQSMELKIFNRWGELLFESKQQEVGWDGTTFNQEMALPGVYIYRLDFVGFERDGSTFVGKKYGTVTLIK